MNHAALAHALVAIGVFAGSSALAEEKVFKYDEWDADIATGANQVNGSAVAGHPGFAQGEAFGQVYRPTADEYPLTILALDFVMAAPPSPNEGAAIDVVFEIYNGPATGADPESQPLFTISNNDIVTTDGQVGVPIQGGIAYHIAFDYNDPQNHPPTIDSGNIWVLVRFTDPTVADSSHWGTAINVVAGCTQLPEFGACGCQAVAPFTDSIRTSSANIIHAYNEGACSGSQRYVYAEDLGVSGDFFLRMVADTAKAACVANCDGRECGSDGCGDVCGVCGDGLSCFQDQCVACIPSCTAAQCGDDGCGDVCGTCNDGQVCADRFCCTPNCNGKDCGGDGCGGSCGACPGTDSCGSDGVCVAECVADCENKACGPDGCGATCGDCASTEVCGSDGACEPVCVPACDGKTCGDDGCGGVCGTCATGESCEAQACVVALSLEDVSPDTGSNEGATAVSITGAGFQEGVTVLLGGTSLTPVTRVSSQVLTASVPAGLTAGEYTVIVTNPDGKSATLTDGFTVTAPEVIVDTGGNNSGGCDAGGSGLPWMLVVVSMGALVLRRRRVA